MTVEGIGTIRNRVVAGAEPPPVRLARLRSRARSRPVDALVEHVAVQDHRTGQVPGG